MPSDRAKAVINQRWNAHRRAYRPSNQALPREAELEAMERFIRERGITQYRLVSHPVRARSLKTTALAL